MPVLSWAVLQALGQPHYAIHPCMNSTHSLMIANVFNLRRTALAIAVSFVAIGVSSPAQALIVMNFDPADNYVAPTTDTLPGYSDVDPGWANITTRGIYLGNGWVISANHTFVNNPSSEDYPGRDTIHGDRFSIVLDSIRTLRNPKPLTDAGYASLADLKLYRLDSYEQFAGTPEQRAITHGRQMQEIIIGDGALSPGSEVVIMGDGNQRISAGELYHWEASTSGAISWEQQGLCDGCLDYTNPNQIAPNGKYHAISYSTSNANTTIGANWGTNRVESDSLVAQQISDVKAVNGTPYYVLDSNTDTAVQAFDFDDYSFVTDEMGNPISGGGNEVRAASGDSGSGVFAWNGSNWELNGVLHSIATYIGTTHASAIRKDRGSSSDEKLGDFTTFSNFAAYQDQIEAYLAPPEGFEFAGTGEDTRFFHLVDRSFAYDSETGDLIVDNPGLWGDVNLDGQVSGDGTGDWATDDVTAFIDGWDWQQASADIFSWKRGDLNQDGITDLGDFLLLRSGLNPEVAAQLSLNQLLVGSTQAVPEPSSVLFASLFGLGVIARRVGRRF